MAHQMQTRVPYRRVNLPVIHPPHQASQISKKKVRGPRRLLKTRTLNKLNQCDHEAIALLARILTIARFRARTHRPQAILLRPRVLLRTRVTCTGTASLRADVVPPHQARASTAVMSKLTSPLLQKVCCLAALVRPSTCPPSSQMVYRQSHLYLRSSLDRLAGRFPLIKDTRLTLKCLTLGNATKRKWVFLVIWRNGSTGPAFHGFLVCLGMISMC